MEKFHEIQEKEGLSLATRLASDHIQWQMHKMKVKLTAQALSSFFADAIEFLHYDLKIPEIGGSEGTIKFIRVIDVAFDVLNSQTPRASGYKRPMQSANYSMCEKSLKNTVDILLNAKSAKSQDDNNKTKNWLCAFFSLKNSILVVTKGLLNKPVHPLSHVLTYRFSQDHLELFFSCIRARSGWKS